MTRTYGNTNVTISQTLRIIQTIMLKGRGWWGGKSSSGGCSLPYPHC